MDFSQHWTILAGLIMSALLTLGFLSSGIPKLLDAEVPAIEFAVWGYPKWMQYFVGITEVLGALAIWHRLTLRWGFLMLAVVVCGAVVTHLRFAEWQALQQVLAFGVLLAATAWWRRTPGPEPTL